MIPVPIHSRNVLNYLNYVMKNVILLSWQRSIDLYDGHINSDFGKESPF